VTEVIWQGDAPALRNPILICGFRGWSDGAGAASMALEAITRSLDARQLAALDPEEFFDFQANRPGIRVADGRVEGIDWHANTFSVARPAGAERDLVMLDGPEPNLRWRSFCEGALEVADRLEIHTVLTLGAFIAEVAHTMAVPMTGIASNSELAGRLGVGMANYQGPTGIVGVLHDALRRREIGSASLWAAVPHYAAAVPNPKAALALVRKVEGVVGVAVEVSGLEREAESFEQQVDRAVAANSEIEEMVRGLEQAQAEIPLGGEEIPNAETIAKEFEQFLRQRESDSN